MKQKMKIKTVIGMTVSLVFAAGIALAATAPQEEVIIDGKKPARFAHSTHLNMGLDCASCHHDITHTPLSADDIGALTDTSTLKCVECHNSKHPVKELQKAKDVFHAKCKACHAEGFAGKKGPTKCTSCHLKKKSKSYEGC